MDGCSDQHTATAQSDQTRPLPKGPSTVPNLAVRWLVPEAAGHRIRISSGVAAATAPSLHALGISRT